ncbi:hypothetical protein Q6U52_000875 [Vibrio alginolyticus]|nr:hypothetical protein [Vibrio alginolyticus]
MLSQNPLTTEIENEIGKILLEKLFDNNQEHLEEISHALSVYKYEIENGVIDLEDNDHFKTFAKYMLNHLFIKEPF